MIMTGVELSLLTERLRTVRHLYDYYRVTCGEAELDERQSVELVKGFLQAKAKGTLNPNVPEFALNWKPSRYKTFSRHLAALAAFNSWHSAFHGAPNLNEIEVRVMNSWERYSDFQARAKWDPLLHLYPSRSNTKKTTSLATVSFHRRLMLGKQKLPKSFPLDEFVELVERSECPRDKMLWLETFGLAQRGSEPLHRFYEDVYGVSELGEALVRLDDPEIGEWQSRGKNGKLVSRTRQQYLTDEWGNAGLVDSYPTLVGLQPRTKYGTKSGMGVGFKGMTFHFQEDLECRSWGHTGVWIDYRLGVYFMKCREAYIRAHFHGKPKGWPYHPFLYINLDSNDYGMPMTLPALRKAWVRAVKRVGLPVQFGEHSLRHLGGYYSANVLNNSLENTQKLLRHAGPTSTEVYYKLSISTVRRELLQAAAKYTDFDLKRLVILPKSTKLDLPSHWTEAAR